MGVQVSTEARRGCWLPWSWSCELPTVGAENGTLQKQDVRFTSESPGQPLLYLLPYLAQVHLYFLLSLLLTTWKPSQTRNRPVCAPDSSAFASDCLWGLEVLKRSKAHWAWPRGRTEDVEFDVHTPVLG